MKKITALAIATLFNGCVLANEPGKSDTGLDYNKIEIDYASAKIGTLSDYKGYYTSGSFLVSENIYVLANYASLTKTAKPDYEKSNLGIGYRLPIAANADFLTSVAYFSQTFAGTKNGYNLSLGARARVIGDADILGAYSYISADNVSYNNFSLGLKVNITNVIFASGGYFSQTGSSSSSGYTLGVGLKF
ncbi:MAG: hypothetical protein EBW49_07565 [Betaproteobacteria bacterium]|jgi:hypothetical protein|nr:hypothetical protein [Betaproteobacteria bacterium]